MKNLRFKHHEMLRLIGSRIYYRLAFLLLNITLFYGWDAQVYGSYGAKVGTWAVLQPLLAVGIGKCALKLLTVHEKLRAWLLREMIKASVIIIFLMNCIVISFNLIWKSMFHAPWDYLDILIGFYSTLGGFSLALQSIGRGLNKDLHDYGVSLVLGSAALVLSLAVLTQTITITPLSLVILLIFLYLGVNLGSLVQLLRQVPLNRSLAKKPRWAIRRRVWRETMVMGLNSLIGNATFSVVSVAFRYYNLYEAAGYFNLVISAGAFGLAFFEYLLRLFLPKAASWAYRDRNHRNDSILKKYMGISVLVILLSLFAGFALALLAPNRIPYLFLLWIFLAPIFLLNEVMIFWFEAISKKKLLHTLYASLAGLMVCTLLIFGTLPWGQAPGALLILGIGEVVTCLYLIISFYRNHQRHAYPEIGYEEDDGKPLPKNSGYPG